MSEQKAENVRPTIGEILATQLMGSEKKGDKGSSKNSLPEPEFKDVSEVAEEAVKAEAVKEEVSKDEVVKEEDADAKENEKAVNLKNAVQEERKKRRALQRELEELKKKMAGLESNNSDYIPMEGKTSHVDETISHTSPDLLKRLASQSCDLWAEVKPDAQELFDVFDEYTEDKPEMWDRFLNAPNPGKFAYEVAKKIKFEREYGSTPDEIEKKVREKVTNELKMKTSPKDVLRQKQTNAKLPQNLSGASSASSDQPIYNKKTAEDLWG